MLHELKTLPSFFEAMVFHKKLFEIRKNDRNFQVGDILLLREWWDGKGYTGAQQYVEVLYLTDFAQQSGYVVMGISMLSPSYTPPDTKKKIRKYGPHWEVSHCDLGYILIARNTDPNIPYGWRLPVTYPYPHDLLGYLEWYASIYPQTLAFPVRFIALEPVECGRATITD